ncbi:MAG: hypothetical protein WBQ21_00090 [Solirubrobacteraceae bacterium]
MKNTTIRAAVALLVAISSVCLLSACGGTSGDPQALLNDTFSSPRQIESGNVNLSVVLGPAGSSTSSKSLAVHLSGPFESTAAGKLPRFALQLGFAAAGHPLQAGVTSTGSALYVNLAGTWFSTPHSTYTALQQSYGQATKRASTAKVRSTFASLGIEPSHWLSEPAEVGTATIDGAPTIHLTASVNVSGFLADVSKLSQAGSALGLSSSGVPGGSLLTPSAISELAKSITATHVDIYTGKSDHMLRRLEFTATVSSTAQTKSILDGLSSAQLKVLLEFSDINKPQTIAAPTNPESSTQLLPALEQLVGALQGVTGTGSGNVLEPLTTG